MLGQARPFVRTGDGRGIGRTQSRDGPEYLGAHKQIGARWVRATGGFSGLLRTQTKQAQGRHCCCDHSRSMDSSQPHAELEQEHAAAAMQAETAAAASHEEALDVALAWAKERRHRRVREALRVSDADAEELNAALAARMSEMADRLARQLAEQRSAHEEQVTALEQARDAAIARAGLAEAAQATAQRRLERAATLLGARTRHTVSDPLVPRGQNRCRAPCIQSSFELRSLPSIAVRRKCCSKAARRCRRS